MNEAMDEILARMRRVETRLTKLMLAQGVEPGSKEVESYRDRVVVPGVYVTLLALLLAARATPVRNADGSVDVYAGSDLIATVYPDVGVPT